MSAPPPAGNGTTKRIGLVGHSDCARAEKGRDEPSAIEPAALSNRRRGSDSLESQDGASRRASSADNASSAWTGWVFERERIMRSPVTPVPCVGNSAKLKSYKLTPWSGRRAAALVQQSCQTGQHQPYRTRYRHRMRSIRIGRGPRINRPVRDRRDEFNWRDDANRRNNASRRLGRCRFLKDRQWRPATATATANRWRSLRHLKRWRHPLTRQAGADALQRILTRTRLAHQTHRRIDRRETGCLFQRRHWCSLRIGQRRAGRNWIVGDRFWRLFGSGNTGRGRRAFTVNHHALPRRAQRPGLCVRLRPGLHLRLRLRRRQRIDVGRLRLANHWRANGRRANDWRTNRRMNRPANHWPRCRRHGCRLGCPGNHTVFRTRDTRQQGERQQQQGAAGRMKSEDGLTNGHGIDQGATEWSIRADERSAEELLHAMRLNRGRHP